MSKWKDFEFCAAGWDKKRWDLRYTGENKDLVIPEKMIAKAGEKATIAISAANGNELESITLPKNIYDVWLGTLYGAKSLKRITVDPENPYLKDIDGVLYTKDGKRLIKVPCQKTGTYIVPEGVEEIELTAFQYSRLDEVILPESLKEIGNCCFQYSELKKVTIPKSLPELEDNVFSDCRELEEFSFLGDTSIQYGYVDMDSEMEKRISGDGFTQTAECYLLACLKSYPNIEKCRRKFIAAAKRGKREKIVEYLLSTLPDTPVEKGTFEISDLEDGTAAIQSYKGEESVIEIPAEMDGKKITAIGKGAFEGNEYVEKVIVPEGVELIEKNAFKGCISLEEVVLPESCTDIGASAFEDCKILKKLNLPQNITVLSRKMLKNCKLLEKLELPKGLVKIDNEALYDCDSITELELPEGLRYLGKECLYACGCNYGPVLPGEWGYSKRKFAIPASVTQIDDGGNGIFAAYPKAQELFGVFEYKVILQVKRGSVAHRYAAKKKIRFELV